MKTLFSCIGSGNMGSALMKAAAEKCGPANIGFSDADQLRAHTVASALGAVEYSSNIQAVQNGRYIVLAVKPQNAEAVLRELAPVFKARREEQDPAVLVSIVAGLSMDTMHAYLKSGSYSPVDFQPTTRAEQPIIRLMPNTPALVLKGLIALSASEACSEPLIAELEDCLSGAAILDRIEESHMNAVTALSGSGPAFVYMFIEALSDAGVQAGLSRDRALQYAARTVLGSAAMVEETSMHPAVLKDAVCSPAGTTIAGVCALEEKGFRSAVMSAVEAAYKRACQLQP